MNFFWKSAYILFFYTWRTEGRRTTKMLEPGVGSTREDHDSCWELTELTRSPTLFVSLGFYIPAALSAPSPGVLALSPSFPLSASLSATTGSPIR